MRRVRTARAHHRNTRPAWCLRPLPLDGPESAGHLVLVRIPLDITDFPTRHNDGLALWQRHTERLLADWATELGMPINRSREVAGFTDKALTSSLADGSFMRANYLVGLRRWPQRRAQASGHRIRGLGSIRQLHDCRSRNVGRAGVRHPPVPRKASMRSAGTRTVGASASCRLAESGVSHTREPTLSSQKLVAVYGTDFKLQQCYVFVAIHRYGSSGGVLSRSACAGSRRRSARPFARRRARTQRRHPGCSEPGMEARAGGEGVVAGEPARHVSRRALSSARACCAMTGRRPRSSQ